MSIESRTCAVEGEELLHEFAGRLASGSRNMQVESMTPNRIPCASSGSISIPDSDATMNENKSPHSESADGVV